MKEREPVERIGLRVVLYGAGTLVTVICLFLMWLILSYNLLPNIFFRLAAVLILLVALAYTFRFIRQVHSEALGDK